MKDWQASALALTCQSMKTNSSTNTSEIRAEQVTKARPETIYLGVDLHKKSISVTRIIDHSTPQPAQRFGWEGFFSFAKKQLSLAKKVYAVYEAGAFGFWPCRKLKDMGLECFVVHPEKLDPHHKRVQTDKLDSRHLADKLQRYVLPQGFGSLTFMLLVREICNYQRFHNRRNVGGFTGLCGAVSSSGAYHLDLSISKAGSAYLRTLLVELAWRMIYWQPNYTALRPWKRLLDKGKLANKRLRKVAVVAIARQLAVDLWRWQTGRVTAQQLGWEMRTAPTRP